MSLSKSVLAVAVASAALAIPQAADAQRRWETIGSREVNGGLDRDVIAVRDRSLSTESVATSGLSG